MMWDMDMELHIGGIDYHYVPEPPPKEEEPAVRNQTEESANRRSNEVGFPHPMDGCATCHEVVWTDQGHLLVKHKDWNEEKDFLLTMYHDDCYDGDDEIVRKFDRKAPPLQ